MLFICHKNENLQSTSSSSCSSNFIHPLLILVPPSLPPPSTTAAASSSCHSTCLASRQTTNHYPELMEIVFFNEIVDGDCWSSSEGWRRRSACNANLYAKSWCGEKFNIFCRGNLLLTDKYYIANLFTKNNTWQFGLKFLWLSKPARWRQSPKVTRNSESQRLPSATKCNLSNAKH